LCDMFARSLLFLLAGPALRSTLFPYTTLFRSVGRVARGPHHDELPLRLVAAADVLEDEEVILRRQVLQVGAELKGGGVGAVGRRSEEHTSELQSRGHLVCRLLLEKKKQPKKHH